jgi:hypothetical protein
MIARELLVKFQMSPKHPLVDLKKAYLKFWFLKYTILGCYFFNNF